MKKQYYLYRLLLNKTDFVFDDMFNTREEAEEIMRHNAKNTSWKVWKIEEVYDYSKGWE